MGVCVFVCVCVCSSVYVFVFVYVYIYTCVCECTYLFEYVLYILLASSHYFKISHNDLYYRRLLEFSLE